MTDEENRSHSPFSELSYSEQQEMWRAWRSKPLEYQDFNVPAPQAETPPPAPPAPPAVLAPQHDLPSGHKNLDRVHARISSAVARAGAFTPFTSGE